MFVKAAVGQGARTLAAHWYTSPEVFAAERERIFARGWVCVGRAEQVERPGDYFLAAVAGESLIITRDTSHALHAFFNVCRHRGTQMCESERGHFSGSIQCPYHAWTYALDGKLSVARNMSDVAGFTTADYPLHEAAIAQWEGFVFVNLAHAQACHPEPVEGFPEAFASIWTRFARWHIGELRTAHAITYELQCNWKLVFLNYSECYHCAPVHPQLERLSPSDSGRNDLTEGPLLGGFSELREPGMGLTMSGKTTWPPLGELDGADLARDYYYTLFPSMMLSLHPDYVMVHYITPLAPDRTRVVCAWLFDPKTMADPAFDSRDAVEFWDITNRQDWHVSELTQRGLLSRAYTPGPYAQAEGLLAAFDRHYLRVMED